MSLKFVYVTLEGRPLKTVQEFRNYTLGRWNEIPSEIWTLIVPRLNLWTRLNFGLTSKGAYDLCFSKVSLRETVLASDFTQSVRWASKSKDLEKYLKITLNLRPLPLNNKYILFPHQVEALSFMRKRERTPVRGIRGGIVQLKMGMGKTLCALAHTLTSPREPCKEKYGSHGFPTLIVASKTVMMEWKKEGISKFFGNRVKVLYLHRDYLGKKYVTLSRRQVVTYDLVITTYDVVGSVGSTRNFIEDVLERGEPNTRWKGKVISIRHKTRGQADKPAVKGPGVIFGTPWERVFADESQTFANPKTKIYKAMMAIYGKYKWGLTGTPVRNYQTDIWAQLRFCGYTGVDKERDWTQVGQFKMTAQHLNRVIFRMDYSDAGIKLPPRKEHSAAVVLSGMEKKIYDYTLGVSVQMFKGMLARKFQYSHILAIFMRMRQCCIAPYLITDESKRKTSKDVKETKNHLREAYKGKFAQWVTDRDGTAGIKSQKMTKTLDILRGIPKGEKVIVFSTFTSALDLLKYACEKLYPEFKALQVDGATSRENRETLLTQFKTDPETQGLFLSYKVGSEGLNLTQATHVVCMEPWWNKAVRQQAVSRAWRFGQTQTVHVYDVLVRNSIEDRILEVCDAKQKMANKYLGGSKGGPTRLNKHTMGEILGVF